MGYFNHDHIKEFVRGQTVRQLTTDDRGYAWLEFESGEKLRMYASSSGSSPYVIATPIAADGSVKQSTEIMAHVRQEESKV